MGRNIRALATVARMQPWARSRLATRHGKIRGVVAPRYPAYRFAHAGYLIAMCAWTSGRPPHYNPRVMPLDTDKIDDAVLALLALTLHNNYRAWKGFDWDALDRLHAKGLIDDPVNKTKSVAFTEEGRARGRFARRDVQEGVVTAARMQP